MQFMFVTSGTGAWCLRPGALLPRPPPSLTATPEEGLNYRPGLAHPVASAPSGDGGAQEGAAPGGQRVVTVEVCLSGSQPPAGTRSVRSGTRVRGATVARAVWPGQDPVWQ